jgi:selenoprotein W-related protein
LIDGGGGIFDVEMDGEVIFSKHDVGRFPDDGEVATLIRERRDRAAAGA